MAYARHMVVNDCAQLTDVPGKVRVRVCAFHMVRKQSSARHLIAIGRLSRDPHAISMELCDQSVRALDALEIPVRDRQCWEHHPAFECIQCHVMHVRIRGDICSVCRVGVPIHVKRRIKEYAMVDAVREAFP